jgi:hypothetical protein
MNLSGWAYSYPCNTSLNSSSGYESASNETSLIESYLSCPLSIMKVRKEAALAHFNLSIVF